MNRLNIGAAANNAPVILNAIATNRGGMGFLAPTIMPTVAANIAAYVAAPF